MVAGDLPQCGQDELDPESTPEGGECRLAGPHPGHQADERDQGRTHGVETPPSPADGPREQDVVSTDEMSGGLDGAGGLDLGNDVLDVAQGAREPRGKAVGEQAESLLASCAVPARNARSGRVASAVGADGAKAAATPRVQRASIKSCGPPGLLGNVVLAGEAHYPSELHRPRPARVQPWRATFFSGSWSGEPHREAPMREVIGAESPTLPDRRAVSPASLTEPHGAVNHEGIRAPTRGMRKARDSHYNHHSA